MVDGFDADDEVVVGTPVLAGRVIKRSLVDGAEDDMDADWFFLPLKEDDDAEEEVVAEPVWGTAPAS